MVWPQQNVGVHKIDAANLSMVLFLNDDEQNDCRLKSNQSNKILIQLHRRHISTYPFSLSQMFHCDRATLLVDGSTGEAFRHCGVLDKFCFGTICVRRWQWRSGAVCIICSSIMSFHYHSDSVRKHLAHSPQCAWYDLKISRLCGIFEWHQHTGQNSIGAQWASERHIYLLWIVELWR